VVIVHVRCALCGPRAPNPNTELLSQALFAWGLGHLWFGAMNLMALISHCRPWQGVRAPVRSDRGVPTRVANNACARSATVAAQSP
jgi:hypothetical protein